MLLLAWAFFLLRPDGAGAATRPSFVLIQLDDFANLHFDSRWVDSFGNTRRSMPLTRQELLAQGVRFTGYQTPTPVCAPSRASLLSGRYALNHGVSGQLDGPSSYLMKSPKNQRPDDQARQDTEKFIKQYARKPGTKAKGRKAPAKKRPTRNAR